MSARWRNHRRTGLCACVLAMGAWGMPAMAQVGAATLDDIADAPPQFKEALSGGKIKPQASELTRQNIQGAPPSQDPRDLNGMYNFLRAPGGPGGAPRAPGAAPPGGPPPRGAAPGGLASPRVSNVGAGACVINNFAGLTSYSTTILINPRQVLFLMEENHLMRWARFADTHDPAAKPSFTGDSIARWDGDTLVIDTTQVATRGKPDTDHYVERMTKQADGNIAIERFRETDGQLAPVEKVALRWRPDLHYVEDICEDFGEAFGIGYQ